MAEDRANNPARQPDLPYKGLEGKQNIASVSRPSHGYEGSGGRIRVTEYTPEEMGPREMTKFDPKNKYHVGMLTSKDESTQGMLMHEGGYFSFPKQEAGSKKPTQPVSKKAVAPQSHADKLKAKEAARKADIERRNKALAKKK